MKLTKSFEQGVCIMAIIATQASGQAVSSRTLQKRLGSSMTYSQKILRKLVVAGLIESTSGTSGGFRLAKPVNQISVLDVVVALEGPVDSFPNTGLISSVFQNQLPNNIDTSIADESIHRIFSTADQTWSQILANVSLADIITRVANGGRIDKSINWNNEGEKNDSPRA